MMGVGEEGRESHMDSVHKGSAGVISKSTVSCTRGGANTLAAVREILSSRWDPPCT